MLFVLLKFSANKDHAKHFKEDHQEWIQRGFGEGGFVLVNACNQAWEGFVAHNTMVADLQSRVNTYLFLAKMSSARKFLRSHRPKPMNS